MYWIAIGIGLLLVLVFLFLDKSPVKKSQYLENHNITKVVSSLNNSNQAINLNSLTNKKSRQKIQQKWHKVERQLGHFAWFKAVVLICVLAIAGFIINQKMLRISNIVAIIVTVVIGLVWGYLWLQEREKKQFNEQFPDALNMLLSSVTSGESITHAIRYVGSKLDGNIGKEFKLMGDRLQLGESPDEVFRKSCVRYPYPSFQFFVITLRVNMNRGGQLKDVITRLNRLIFDARAIERKKYALTSESRMSAKIVCAVPFFFLFILQFLSPENYDFVMFSSEGRPILYYVVISELIGMTIIWGLLKKAR
jgi:tight adherence protein B